MPTESWNDYENETLIQYHKIAKVNKKKYQRASDFHNTLYRFFGFITILSSTMGATLSWGEDIDDNIILKVSTIISVISSTMQNFYKFQENSNNYNVTSKTYGKIQNKLESVGNIHPEYRSTLPSDLFKKIQDKFDQVAESRIEVTKYMNKLYYNRGSDNISYLQNKHDKYKNLQDDIKLKFSKTDGITITIESEEESDDEIS